MHQLLTPGNDGAVDHCDYTIIPNTRHKNIKRNLNTKRFLGLFLYADQTGNYSHVVIALERYLNRNISPITETILPQK